MGASVMGPSGRPVGVPPTVQPSPTDLFQRGRRIRALALLGVLHQGLHSVPRHGAAVGAARRRRPLLLHRCGAAGRARLGSCMAPAPELAGSWRGRRARAWGRLGSAAASCSSWRRAGVTRSCMAAMWLRLQPPPAVQDSRSEVAVGGHSGHSSAREQPPGHCRHADCSSWRSPAAPQTLRPEQGSLRAHWARRVGSQAAFLEQQCCEAAGRCSQVRVKPLPPQEVFERRLGGCVLAAGSPLGCVTPQFSTWRRQRAGVPALALAAAAGAACA